MLQEWSKDPGGERVWCPLDGASVHLCHSFIISRTLGGGEPLWAEMKDDVLLIWNIIYQYVFFPHVYKQYLKVKQNRVVEARCVFSPWKMQCSVRLLGKDDFLLWSKWPTFFLC